MKTRSSRSWHLLSILATVGVFVAPHGASAQSALDTSEAQAFLGNWTVAFQSDMGEFEFGLDLRDSDGKVAALVTSDLGNIDVGRISRSGESLVLAYDMDVEGQSIPVSMDLRPDGERLRATMNVAGGAFTASGNATRAAN